MSSDFHIDFLKKFDVRLTSFGFIQGDFGVPWGHLGVKMEAKERARFVPKWGPAPQGAPGPILEAFRTLWDPLGHPLGRFWETCLASFLLSRRAMRVT